MLTKLRNLLEIWSDGGLTVQLTLTTGDVVEGHVREIDRDEIVLEPIVDGEPGPLTVVLFAHVVMATYTDRAANLDE
jgi:hypothetical protein